MADSAGCSSTAVVMTFHYSTDDVRPHERTQYWRDSVAAHLIPAEAHYTDPQSFQGYLRGGALGGLTVCEMKAQPLTFVRSRQSARQESDEDFVLTLVREGGMRFEQNGHGVRANAGSIILLDAARPFTHEMEKIRSLIVRLPRRQFLATYPRAEAMTGMELARDNALTALLHHIVNEAFSLQSSGGMQAGEPRFAYALIDMLIAVMEQNDADSERGTSNYGHIRRRAIKHIDEKLDRCDMDIRSIANSINTSPRTLARAFASHGSTVMRHVWRRRLEFASSLLSEGRVANVTQAAYDAGFNDLSHFTRAFKAAFGVTPGSLLRNQPSGRETGAAD